MERYSDNLIFVDFDGRTAIDLGRGDLAHAVCAALCADYAGAKIPVTDGRVFYLNSGCSVEMYKYIYDTVMSHGK